MSLRHEVAAHRRPTAQTVELRRQDRGDEGAVDGDAEETVPCAATPEAEPVAEVKDPRE